MFELKLQQWMKCAMKVSWYIGPDPKPRLSMQRSVKNWFWYRYRFFSSQEVMVIDIGSLKSKSLRRRKKGRRGDPDQKKKKVWVFAFISLSKDSSYVSHTTKVKKVFLSYSFGLLRAEDVSNLAPRFWPTTIRDGFDLRTLDSKTCVEFFINFLLHFSPFRFSICICTSFRPSQPSKAA